MIAMALGNIWGIGQFCFLGDDLLYEGESVYNYLQVKKTDDSVILSTNVLFGVQSIMKKGGATGMYYDYALAAPVMAGKENPRILILGMQMIDELIRKELSHYKNIFQKEGLRGLLNSL